MSARQVAERLGLNDAWYQDLEQNDAELAATLTLFQAIELASLLSVRLQDLLGADSSTVESIALLELPSRIEAQVAQQGISMQEFEEQIGWGLEEFLQSPIRVAAELPIAFLQDLAAALGIHWFALIPEGTQPG
ncbi:MAG TPA: hypothetical protein VGN07_16565 [Steroidobacteraceae bacterium]|jgi:transcriptional regulator with XRE-family HTH domain